MKYAPCFKHALAVVALVTTPMAWSADWKPSGPITLEVGFGAGGSADTIARVVAKEVEDQQGWRIIIDNKPGGGGAVMAGSLIRKPADGQRIGLAISEAMIFNLATRPDNPYSLEDLDFLGTAGIAPISLIAKPDAPFDDIQGLVAYAKANGGATVAVPSKGTELLIRHIAKQSGAAIRPVPASGGSVVLQQTLGGHVTAGFDGGAHVKYVQDGELKVIAAATQVRHPEAKDQPTVSEQGFDAGYQEPSFVFFAPKGLSPESKQTLAAAIDKAVSSQKVSQALSQRMQIVPRNLGADGTEAMMKKALDGAKNLVQTVRN